MLFSGFNGPRTRNAFYLGPLLFILIPFGNQLRNCVSDDLLCNYARTAFLNFLPFAVENCFWKC